MLEKNQWLSLFPNDLQIMLRRLPSQELNLIEEIRVRLRRPLEIVFANDYRFLMADGKLTQQPKKAYCPTTEDGDRILDAITNHSFYTMEEELRQGFITVEGGHRVGLSGHILLSEGKVERFRHITGFSFRVARERVGIAEDVIPYLFDLSTQSIKQTLIISPPQHGKTTLLRDLSRLISYGSCLTNHYHWRGCKVGIVDERFEISGGYQGTPSFDVGPRTDVLGGCPKAEGMMMMIRAMSPHVLIVDEIGKEADALAIQEAIYAGVSVVASAHARYLEEIKHRPSLSSLIQQHAFERYVLLNRDNKGLTFRVFESNFNPLTHREIVVRVV